MIKFLVLAGLAWLVWRWLKTPLRRPSRTSGALQQARRLLEVGPDADEAGVRSAHRRLVARVHPDAGGSAELFQRVNEARDILLDHLNRSKPRTF